jgi:hypothetical protein
MPDFGPLAAQNDQQLLSYFHKTEQADDVVNFKKPLSSFLFVARPGAGKTALLRWLRDQSGNAVPLVVGPDDTRLFWDDAASNIGDIRVMIGAELGAALISEIVERRLGSAKNLRKAEQFIAKGWLGVVGGFFKRKFSGLSILGCGLSLRGDERRDYLHEIRTTGRSDAARTVLRDFAGNVNILLVIDDPELIVGQGLVDVTRENALRVGAFLSVLADLHASGIRVIVFLKEHIVQNALAYYPDFRHFVDRIDGLEWKSQDLIGMLQERVTKRLHSTWDEIFDLSAEEMEREILPFLVNGPRDLLRICNAAGKLKGKVTKDSLQKVIKTLRSDKWVELSSNYGDQWPKIDLFARAMISAIVAKHPRGKIRSGEINALFEDQHADPSSAIHALRKKESWVDNAKWDEPPIDQRLFLMGCIGYVRDGETIYPWAGRSLDEFRLADSYFVSPLFAA